VGTSMRGTAPRDKGKWNSGSKGVRPASSGTGASRLRRPLSPKKKKSPLAVVFVMAALVAAVLLILQFRDRWTIPTGGMQPKQSSVPSSPSFWQAGLVAYYPFNGNARDGSGNGRHGSLLNDEVTPAASRSGVPDTAFRFTGPGSGVLLEDEQLDLDEYTFNLWVSVDSFEIERGWLGICSDANNDFCMLQGSSSSAGHDNSGKFSLRFSRPNKAVYHMGPPANIPFVKEAWNMISVTKKEDTMVLFLDGVTLSTKTAPSIVENSLTAPLYIGKGVGYNYNGRIDDIRIYDRALNGAEVAKLYKFESKGITHTVAEKKVSSSSTGIDLPGQQAAGVNKDGTKPPDKAPSTSVSAFRNFDPSRDVSVDIVGIPQVGRPIGQDNDNDFSLTNSTIARNKAPGTIIGRFKLLDPQPGGVVANLNYTFDPGDPLNADWLIQDKSKASISNGRLNLKSKTSVLLSKSLPDQFSMEYTAAKSQWSGYFYFVVLEKKGAASGAKWTFGAHGTWWTHLSLSGGNRVEPSSGLHRSYSIPGTFPSGKGVKYLIKRTPEKVTVHTNGTLLYNTAFSVFKSGYFQIRNQMPEVRSWLDDVVIKGVTSRSFALASGSGDTDNALFTIEGDQLKVSGDFNSNTRESGAFAIRVKATYASGQSIEKVFTIRVTEF
jgi:hypothetical protein